MRIEVKTIPATQEIVQRAIEAEKNAETEEKPKKVTKRKNVKKEE